MGWFLFVVLLLAVVFGVAGAVVKATAFIVLTILATVMALAIATTLAIRYGWWRATRDLRGRTAASEDGITRRRDDRY